MKTSKLGPWVAITIGMLYFIVPLIATFEFSMRMRKGEYSLDAYGVVLGDPRFQASFLYSTGQALATILVGVLLVVPTSYWIQLRLPRLRGIVEFLTLLPLVIPAICLVFGYLRLYNSSSWLPMTGSDRTTDLLLMFSYVALALPYMYRAVDTGMRAIDVRTLTEAAESSGRKVADDPVPRDLPECPHRHSQRRISHLRYGHRRIHHGEPVGPAGLRPLSAAHRRQSRL